MFFGSDAGGTSAPSVELGKTIYWYLGQKNPELERTKLARKESVGLVMMYSLLVGSLCGGNTTPTVVVFVLQIVSFI